MTRLLTTGYETGDVAEAGNSSAFGNTSCSVVNTVPTPRAGAYCLKVSSTTSTFAGPTAKTFLLAASKTDAWLRFAFLAHALPLGGDYPIALASDSASAGQTLLTYNPNDGLLRVFRGATTTTLLGTATVSFTMDTWHVIDWRVQITSTTVGVLEVWLDGNRVINFSGDNTATANANVQSFAVGLPISSSVGAAAGAYLAFDDIAINDTAGTINNGRPGEGRVVLLVPSGPGTSTQFARGGVDTGANWSQVNEVPPSLTQYVASAVVGQRDLYAVADLGSAVQSINVVELLLLAQNSDAGGGSIGPTLVSGATTNEATAVGLTTTAAYITARYETDPNTSAAWTATAVNGLQIGETVR